MDSLVKLFVDSSPNLLISKKCKISRNISYDHCKGSFAHGEFLYGQKWVAWLLFTHDDAKSSKKKTHIVVVKYGRIEQQGGITSCKHSTWNSH